VLSPAKGDVCRLFEAGSVRDDASLLVAKSSTVELDVLKWKGAEPWAGGEGNWYTWRRIDASFTTPTSREVALRVLLSLVGVNSTGGD